MKVRDIITDLTEIRRIIEHNEQVYANKLDSLYEISRFLETQILKTNSRRNGKSEHTSEDTELVVKNLPMKKSQAQMVSLNSTKHLKNSNPFQTLPKNRR